MALMECERLFLDEVLKWKDADDAMVYLLQNYARGGVENVRLLLKAIPRIADVAIDQMAETVAMQSQASYWLMFQRNLKPDNSGTFFASMLPVCMARFPNGNSVGCCQAERDYFELFLTLFQDKKQFSWEKDKRWADTQGYTDYLRLVESQLAGGEK